MTILHADDDKDDRELLTEALEQIDPSICCIAANDGREALNILQRNQQTNTLPDYIFLDVNMPIMDGRKCLAELKKDTILKNIPVVIYSTTMNIQEIRDLSNLGACDFLSKANTFGELCTSLNLVINKLKGLRTTAS